MHKESIATSTFKFISLKIVGDLVYFPIWWYTVGLKERFFVFLKQVKNVERRLALKIWLKNIFVPMYGFYDIWSRFISFVIRIIMLVYKTVAFFLWLAFYFLLLLIFIILPIFVVYMFLRSMSF